MLGTPIAYHLEHGQEHIKYPADAYSIRIDTGVLMVYSKRPKSMCEGDNDELLLAYSLGEWRTLEVQYLQDE